VQQHRHCQQHLRHRHCCPALQPLLHCETLPGSQQRLQRQQVKEQLACLRLLRSLLLVEA
jgi:hypothetical protein